jgi:TetR/AcrR family transcriptional regulator, ethionamide resistance regulator
MARPGEMPKAKARLADGAADTQQRILDATERLLSALPLRDISVEQILADAMVSRRTFYVYFASKFGIITKLAERVMEDIYAAISPVVAEDREPGPAAFRQALQAGCAVWETHRPVLRAITDHWQEVPDLGEIWLEWMHRFTTNLAIGIEAERAAGLAPDGINAEALASSLMWASAQLLYLSGLDVVEQLPRNDALIDALVTLWTGSIYGPPVT